MKTLKLIAALMGFTSARFIGFYIVAAFCLYVTRNEEGYTAWLIVGIVWLFMLAMNIGIYLKEKE